MTDIDKQVKDQIGLYVDYCRSAAKHDEWEAYYKATAHALFYHIQEIRSTGVYKPFGRVTCK